MRLLMIAMKDRTAEYFFPPFFVRSNAEAIRAFTGIMADPGRTGAPAEYELVELGQFDDQTAQVDVLAVPRLLANGTDVVKTNGVKHDG